MTTIRLGLAIVATGLWSGLLLTLTTILHPIYAARLFLAAAYTNGG